VNFVYIFIFIEDYARFIKPVYGAFKPFTDAVYFRF
jgi:hypothetical protein